MGTTVRREPINYKIPDYPDYKFLNINDFRGMNMSDNPFIVSPKTASDALNVYVDEQNALTTRPRLEKIRDKLTGMTEFLGVYPISSGYLVHAMNGTQPVIWLLTSDYKIATQVTGSIPSGKRLSVFEQNDNIYLLDGISYKFISKYVCADVEGYIPTTSVGKNKKTIKSSTDGVETIEIYTEGTTFDDLNVLSTKYKETYFWDGETNPDALKKKDSDIIENNYIKQSIKNSNTFIPIRFMEKYTSTIQNNTLGGAHYLALKESNMTELFDVYVNEFGEIESKSYGIPSQHTDIGKYGYLWGDCSDDGGVVAYFYYSKDLSKKSEGGLNVYRKDTKQWYTLFDNDVNRICSITPDFENQIYPIRMSADGEVIVASVKNEYGEQFTLLYLWEKDTDNSYKYKEYMFNHQAPTSTTGDIDFVLEGLNLSRNGDRIYVFSNTDEFDETQRAHQFFCFDQVRTSKLTKIVIHSLPIARPTPGFPHLIYDLSYDGALYYKIPAFDTHPSECGIYDISDNQNVWSDFDPQWEKQILNANKLVINRDKTKLFLLNTETGYSEGYINFKEQYFMPLNITTNPSIQATYAEDTTLYFTENLSRFFSGHYVEPFKSNIGVNYYDLSSTEPLITVTYSIDDKHKYYEEWKKRHDSFFKSFLTTRFDNERWFASGNVLFRTSNNDPTYIPNYNDLGETDEDITGFNILQDDLLGVYKDNFIWTVSPTVTEDINGKKIYTYTYQESKNTVGNNAIGASIVSVYTEIPLQIAYDGVYGLKQISNVQSPARISELLSEAISKKWLKESREKIKKVKTLNRLYWTYFIFSYDKFTKIYLLDNRTMSWYYWELPIQTLDAMIKDNVTVFVATDGTFYRFATTDKINKYNPNRTEYYDEIKNKKEPIKWFWKSQILSLNAINNPKRLVDTTFILADTDESDEYSLNYKFKTYRKLANESGITTISDKLNYIQSTTVKTKIYKFHFVQLEISNVEEDVNNNKFRLIGLGLKYLLVGYNH